MTMTPRRLATAAILVLSATSASAQQGGQIEEAKRLYASAAFENALAVLQGVNGTGSNAPDMLQYKVLCLLALGRSTEAQQAADSLVSAAPDFVPASEEVSPRFAALLTDTRRRLVPEVAKRKFVDAREQLRAKNESAAKKQFEQVLLLAEDPVWRDQREAEDLRTLASGFLDLMHAATPAADSAPSVNVAAETVSPGARAVQAQAERTAGKGLLPPIPVTQSMPKWQPRDAVTALRRYAGSVRVRIGTDGHVVSAVMEVPTDPDYDRQLLEAAKSWTYRPATRNGEPVEVEKLVTFFLRTQ